jgi:biopolymer transport protein ExbD
MVTEDRHAGATVTCPGCGIAVTVLSAGPSQAAAKAAAEPAVATQAAPGGARPAAGDSDETESVRFSGRRTEDEGMDMTPMVDVTFLLLIFFMVTAAYSLQKSIEVPPPDQSESAAQARTLEEIEQDDDYVIIEVHRDNTVWVNDREAPTRQEVLSILREARQGPPGSSTPGPSSLLVLADGDAKYETVIMALDAGNAVGMESVRLASVDEEDF